jgi:hypothetical protein
MAATSSSKSAAQSSTSRPSSGGSAASGAVPEFTKGQELFVLREMLSIRRFEEKAGQMYGMGLIGGFCHLYIGQEAVVVGMQMALKPGDQVITGYRDHGHMLACAMEPKGVMAELTGRQQGYSRGKGGSMHMFSVEKGFFGGHGIVGAQVPLGTGLAFANRYRDNDNVCLTYFGDGAANQGQVYESFNMAALWKLPVVYVIENNRYAMGTVIDRSSATVDLSRRGVSFNIEGGEMVPRRQMSLHSGNAHLSLSRSFHVRSGQVSFAGRSRQGAHGPRSHRASASSAPGKEMGERGAVETNRRGGACHRQRGCRIRYQRPGTRSFRALHRRLALIRNLPRSDGHCL